MDDESKDKLNKALRFINGEEIAGVRYDDPSDHEVKGSGRGKLYFTRGTDPRSWAVSVTGSAPQRGWVMHQILTQKNNCDLFFVEDIHHMCLRCDEALDSLNNISDNVIDVAFCRAWNGVSEHTTEELMSILEKKFPHLGEHLWSELSSTGKRYYFDKYLPMVRAYVSREIKPIVIHDDNGMRRNAWIHYRMTDGRTSRLSPKGSGRVSSSHFINPHVITKEARSSLIRARPDHKIVMLDYNAAELRTLAALSGDKRLLKALGRNIDPYLIIASEFKHLDLKRSDYKRIMIRYIYGSTPEALARDYDIDIRMVQKIYDTIDDFFPDAIRYIDEMVETAIEDGGVHTPTGRFITMDDESTVRTKIPNAVLQSTTADANNLMYARFIQRCKRSTPLIHIHDGYVFEVPDHCLDEEIDFLRGLAVDNPLVDFGLDKLILDVKIDTGDCWF